MKDFNVKNVIFKQTEIIERFKFENDYLKNQSNILDHRNNSLIIWNCLITLIIMLLLAYEILGVK